MPFLDTILDIFFPSKCLNCGVAGAELCSKCLADFPAAERESEKWIFPVYDYRNPGVKQAVWLLKYSGKKGLAKIFAQVIYGRMLEELSDLSTMENFRDALLIPIPLSPIRARERGFNQAELICKELVHQDKNKNFNLAKNILVKPKDTEHQARIENRAERLRNIVGSFAVKNSEQIKGKNIILIDDVTTTGATLSEARKVLGESGVRNIVAFTFAH